MANIKMYTICLNVKGEWHPFLTPSCSRAFINETLLFFIANRKVMLFNDLSNVLHANGLRFAKYKVNR